MSDAHVQHQRTTNLPVTVGALLGILAGVPRDATVEILDGELLTFLWDEDRPRDAAPPTSPGFEKAFAGSLARAGWLLTEACAGRPVTRCASTACRWAGREHYWAPDCPPR